MCKNSTEIDSNIERLRALGRRILDQQVLSAIEMQIAELEAQKAALDPGRTDGADAVAHGATAGNRR